MLNVLPTQGSKCSERYALIANPFSRSLKDIHPGELGLGPEEIKSATKPIEIQPLKDIEVLECGPSLVASLIGFDDMML
jgi:hypothetical protein